MLGQGIVRLGIDLAPLAQFAANTAIFSTTVGVSSRASNPSVSRNGKKRLPTQRATILQFLPLDRPVHGGHGAFAGNHFAPRAALGTGRLGHLKGHDLPHVSLLNPAAQLPPQVAAIFTG